jgi:hypothetical protein
MLGRKSELKAHPSLPLRGPRQALHSLPAAAARRMRREFPPRPLTGRRLIGSLRSKFFAGFAVTWPLSDYRLT